MSERGFGADLETALSADSPNLALLVFIDWPNDPLRVWTGIGTISWDGEDWVGTGDLGHIDKVADSVTKDNIGVELTLNYLNDDLRNEVITTDPVGAAASIFLAVMDEGQVEEAYEIFPGFVDEISILDAGETGSIKVRLASELARMARPLWFQLSDAHQQDLFPGDRGMEFAPRMNETIYWGRKPGGPRTGGGGRPRNPNETWERF